MAPVAAATWGTVTETGDRHVGGSAADDLPGTAGSKLLNCDDVLDGGSAGTPSAYLGALQRDV